MNINDIQNYELEITANCNAECPICARTRRGMKLTGNNSLSLKDIKHIFPHQILIENKDFDLCGTLGDPIVNPECYKICEYLNNNGARRVNLSTNAGYNSAQWWEKLATLKNVRVGFAVDGFRQTNHIYRVNVNFKIVERNMFAYCNAGGKGNWKYIVFEHNKSELEIAQNFAKKLGLKFMVRGGGRNVIASNTKHKPRKSEEVELVPVLKKDISQHMALNKDDIQENLHTIDCRHLNNNYLFIGSDMTLYPCCHLYAYTTAGNKEYVSDLPKNWNCLKTKTINEILSHTNFKEIKKMWSPYHNRYVPKCFATCGSKGIYLDFDKEL